MDSWPMSWMQTKSWVRDFCSFAVQGRWAVKLICGCMGKDILIIVHPTVYNEKIQMLEMEGGQIQSENKARKTPLGSWVLVVQYCCRCGQEWSCFPRWSLVPAHTSQDKVFPSVVKRSPRAGPKASQQPNDEDVQWICLSFQEYHWRYSYEEGRFSWWLLPYKWFIHIANVLLRRWKLCIQII